MSEPDNSSRTSNVKKITLRIQATIIGVLLISMVWVVLPSTLTFSIPQLLPTAAFATVNGGVTCEGETATITGTNGNNDITGTSGDDVIAGLGGNDRIRALGGNDIVCGGAGNDDMDGGEGRDELVGAAGNDRANGGAGNDICSAESEISCDEPDTTAPVIAVPEAITVDATDADGAEVTFEVSAEDDVDGQVGVSCTPESGSIFPIGTTTVTCTATDEAGNEATETFTVTVQDTTAPILTVPEDITVVDTNGDGSEVVTFEVTAQDDVDGPIEVTCDSNSGDTFEIGETVVTCSAEDAAGNEATETFTVTVTPPPDTTAPTLTVPEDITAQGAASGAVVTFEVTAQDDVDGTATLEEDNTPTQDNVGGDIEISCNPPSGSTFPLGSTDVECTASDAAGNTAEPASFTVTVNRATCIGLSATIVGTNGDDVLTGTVGDNVIAGLGGNDEINALGGNDLICGNDGNDIINGGVGNDNMVGGVGNDNMVGGDGNDGLLGEAGDDSMSGEAGGDFMNGGAGNDNMSGGAGDDFGMSGGAGDDSMNGGAGDEGMFGDDGNDNLNSVDGVVNNDGLNGLQGSDTCISDPDPEVNCERD